MTTELEVKKKNQSAKAVRDSGDIPCIVYGPKQEPVPVTVDRAIFEKTLHAVGESTIISLKGLDEEIEVLIHDVAFNAAKGGVEHVDFYAIERGKELTTNVALEFVGVAPIEKTGASVTKAVHELEVTCLPRNLPPHLEVDISTLDSEEAQIKVRDIKVPEGVTIEADPEMAIVTVSAVREEEPEEVVESIDMDAVEVEKKGKEEGEEETKEEEK